MSFKLCFLYAGNVEFEQCFKMGRLCRHDFNFKIIILMILLSAKHGSS